MIRASSRLVSSRKFSLRCAESVVNQFAISFDEAGLTRAHSLSWEDCDYPTIPLGDSGEDFGARTLESSRLHLREYALFRGAFGPPKRGVTVSALEGVVAWPLGYATEEHDSPVGSTNLRDRILE